VVGDTLDGYTAISPPTFEHVRHDEEPLHGEISQSDRRA